MAIVRQSPAATKDVRIAFQAIRCRRRHQPRRPPLAKIKPGSPAPTMGPGTTAASTVCRSTLLASSDAVTSRNLKLPALSILKVPSQPLPGPRIVQEKTDEPPGIVPLPSVPAICVPITTTVSPLVTLFAEKLMVDEVSTSFERSSWMKLVVVISFSPLGSFVRPRPSSSLPKFFPNRCGQVPVEVGVHPVAGPKAEAV